MPETIQSLVVSGSNLLLAKALRDRTLALDAWLQEILGQPWQELKSAWGLPDPLPSAPQHLWRFFLAAAELSRQAMRSPQGPMVAAATAAEWATNAPQQLTLCHNNERDSICLVADHEAFRADLRAASHPSARGVVLSGLENNEEFMGQKSRLQDSLALLADCSAHSRQLVRDNCGAVCLLSIDPPLALGTCISLTSKTIPGLVYFNPVPIIMTMECLVHESAHLSLSSLERCGSLCTGEQLLFSTPLRPDPRPVSGLIHQAWVLVHLCELYARLSGHDAEVLVRNRPKIIRRFDLHRASLYEATDLLESAKASLSSTGCEVIRIIAQRGLEFS